jgi:hypothetical protein
MLWNRQIGAWATSALLVAVGAVHLYLYLGSGYRFIPTIGWLFLVTVVASAALAFLVATRPSTMARVAAGLFCSGVLGGYILSLVLPHGIFQFKEPGVTAAGWVAIAAEIGVVLLAVVCTANSLKTLRTRPQQHNR